MSNTPRTDAVVNEFPDDADPVNQTSLEAALIALALQLERELGLERQKSVRPEAARTWRKLEDTVSTPSATPVFRSAAHSGFKHWFYIIGYMGETWCYEVDVPPLPPGPQRGSE